MAFNSNYQIAAGNNNAAGLTALQSIVPSGNIAFAPPAAKGHRNPGLRRIRGDGSVMTSGFVSQIWRMVYLTYEQYAYLKTTYCGGGYSGAITARTQFIAGTFANYNAQLIIPFEHELQDFGWGYKPVELRLTRMVAL